jgi:hypothetical protein
MTTDRLHTLTHRVPGVPAHIDRAPQEGHQGETHRNAPHRHRAHTVHARRAREPRVLVRWQNWIASLATRGGSPRD